MRCTIPGRVLQRMLIILQRSFVDARQMTGNENKSEQLFHLTGTFEILPQLLYDWRAENFERVRNILSDYQEMYPDFATNYLAIFDMKDKEFEEIFGSCNSVDSSSNAK